MAYLQQNPLSYEVKNNFIKVSQRQLDIIEASGKLLTQSGSNGLTIKNLAKAMNFSEAALYRHFTNKEEIIVSTLEFLTFKLDNEFSEMDKSLNPKLRFMKYFESITNYFYANPHYLTVGFSDGLFDHTPLVNEALAGFNSMLQKHLIPIIMDGKLDNTFPMEVNSEKIVHIVLGSLRLQMSKWRLSNFTSDINRTGIDLAQTLLGLFEKKS